mgnify:CR=1 FL=1
MIRKILIGIVIAIGVLLVVIAMQPSDYRVSRTTTIAAPAEVVFGHVNNLQKMHAWSPWTKLDPAATYTFEGPAEGNGAAATWSGNSQVGAGRQTIVETRRPELVRLKLEFSRPFEGGATTEFTFVPRGDQTEVTWTMFGEQNFVSKGIGLFMSMDKMVGGNFEKGLADLKVTAENEAKKRHPLDEAVNFPLIAPAN